MDTYVEKIIGAQLMTIRPFMTTLDECAESFKRIREIGYTTAQLSGGFPLTAEQVIELSKNADLKITSTHVKPLEGLFDDLDGVIKYHQKIGAKIVGLGNMPRNIYGESKEGYLKFAEDFSKMADKVAANGLVLSYHNHAFEFKKIDGKFAMDFLIENSSPNLKFTFDVCWIADAGVDPARYLRKHASRIGALHYKDFVVEDKNAHVLCEVMEGNLDWDSIIEAADDLQVEHIYVEQDKYKRNPFDCLETSYKNLQTKGYK